VLERAGIAEARILLAVTSVDEVNILACGLAAQYGVPTRIARIRNRELIRDPEHIDLAPLGVTRAINPEGIVVRVIDQIARIPDVVEVFGYHEGEILIARHVLTAGMPIVGRSLVEILGAAGSGRLLSVLLRRGAEVRIPVGSDVLAPGDDVTTLFPRGSLPKYLDLLGLSGRAARKAVIAGDGLTAIQLGEVLSRWIPDVTLVSRDAAHAERAAAQLGRVEVLYGEPTDRDVLHDVNVAGADLFVGAGRDTPQNVMSALLARAEGAGRVLAVSFEPQNNRLFRNIGVDHVISPRRAVNQEIIDIILRGRGALELHLRDMDFQAVQLQAEPGSPITRAPLIETWKDLKGQAIVGAVVHQGRMLVPGGDTRIEAGDDAIVIASPRAARRIQKLFGSR